MTFVVTESCIKCRYTDLYPEQGRQPRMGAIDRHDIYRY